MVFAFTEKMSTWEEFLQGEEKEVIGTINSWHFRYLTDSYCISSYSKVPKYLDLTPNV